MAWRRNLEFRPPKWLSGAEKGVCFQDCAYFGPRRIEGLDGLRKELLLLIRDKGHTPDRIRSVLFEEVSTQAAQFGIAWGTVYTLDFGDKAYYDTCPVTRKLLSRVSQITQNALPKGI